MSSTEAMWYLSRSTGIVAAVLAVASLVLGFLFSARATGNRRRPNWWLDLHNWLGGLTMVFTAVHIVASYLNEDAAISVAQVFVPGIASFDRWALAWGVVGTYLFAGAVFTSWPRRRFSRKTWRIIHLGSVVGVALALVHGYQMGSDVGGTVATVTLLGLVAVGTYSLGLRGISALMQRRLRSADDHPRLTTHR